MNDDTRKKPKSGTGGSVVPEAVRELLEQRGTYREWLGRLDDVGSRYRPEVAERVREDYRARLDGVGEELEEHRHDLMSTLEERRERLGRLSDDFERRSAELEEAELRFQVGEFDEETWDERRAELTEGLEEIQAELDGARAAVSELEGVLTELGGSGAAGGEAEAPSRNGAPRVAQTPSASAAAAAVGTATETGPAVAPAAESDEKPGVEAAATETAAEPAVGTADAGEPARDVEAREVKAEEADEEVEEPEAEQEEAPAERVTATAGSESGAAGEEGGSDDYLDELEFLESLSLDDPDSFDAVSRMLEDEEDR